MYGIVTYWTFSPRMVGQRQIMKNTWPHRAILAALGGYKQIGHDGTVDVVFNTTCSI